MGPGAYTESDKNAHTVEPPLQHKKRIDGPPTSLSTEYFSKPSAAPEYTLLGQQDKFAQNVKYQAKQTASGGIYKNKENFDNDPPPRKQLKMQKRIKPFVKEHHHHPSVSRSFQYLQDTQTPLSPPPAPRGHKDNIELKVAMKDKDLRDVLGDKVPNNKPETCASQTAQTAQKKDLSKKNELVQADKKDVAVSIPVDKEVKKSKDLRVHKDAPSVSRAQEQETQNRQKKEDVSTMNEFVQTNMKRGVAVSSPEAPDDYALKYKAHIAPPRQAKKVSEYQKQFQWKENIKSSPLLNAEEIVFRSKTDLGPYKSDHVPRVSEYRREFHPWKPEVYSSDLNFNYNNNINNSNINNNRSFKSERKKKTQVKRSKSAGAVHQHKESFDKDIDNKASESEPGELRVRLKKSHGKIRHVTTEYRANFQSPTSYKYDHGAWRGACPPQLIPQITNDETNLNTNANNNAENPPLSNWFSEVIELRRRAEEYRKRAQGTHFSREHLVQLLAKQNDCWDINSDASSTIKALNLENPVERARANKKLPESHSGLKRNSPVMSDVDEPEQYQETMEDDEIIEEKNKGNKGQERKSRKMAWLEEHKEKIAQQKRKLEKERTKLENEAGDDDVASEVKQVGRLPTPVLQQKASPIRRHHLDLTTPSVGGAILTCPPSKDSKMIVTSRSGDSYVTASDDYPVKSMQKTYKIDNLWTTVPIYGKPSEDTHYLRNDSADSDSPLTTQFIASPPLCESDEDKENQNEQKHPKRRSKNKRSYGLTAVPEGYGRTYNVSKPFVSRDDVDQHDDDVLSDSLISVASSSSLASEVLERTKKRQEFWNKKP